MIKIFILVTAFSFISPWGSEECQNGPLKPRVTFFTSEQIAAKIYQEESNSKKRLYVVKFSIWNKSVSVDELYAVPSTKYEIITSSELIKNWEAKP